MGGKSTFGECAQNNITILYCLFINAYVSLVAYALARWAGRSDTFARSEMAIIEAFRPWMWPKNCP